MIYSRDKIRKYITKTVGRDPQDYFEVLSQDKELTHLIVRFSNRKQDDLELAIPTEKTK
jgi:hypothetical protein